MDDERYPSPAGAVSIRSANGKVTGCRFENNSAFAAGALMMYKVMIFNLIQSMKQTEPKK